MQETTESISPSAAEKKVYRSKNIWVAAFLGGPLAAAYCVAANFHSFHEPIKARNTWVGAILSIILLLGILLFIPSIQDTPLRMIPLSYVIIATMLHKHYQEEKVKEHIKAGGNVHGWGRVVVISLLSLIITALSIAVLTIGYSVLDDSPTSLQENIFSSTREQDKQRLERMNMAATPSDASTLLDTSILVIPKGEVPSDDEKYQANPEKEWILNLRIPKGKTCTKDILSSLFDYSWRKEFEAAEVYGYSPAEKQWTYAMSGGSPELYSKVQVGINLLAVYKGEKNIYSPEKLERYRSELQKRIAQCPLPLEIEPLESITAAIEKGKRLVDIYQQFNNDAIIVLKSDKAFDGNAVWKALYAVGLQWGDGDIFHWDNNARYGDQFHFSVWTTSDPGYFLPEQIQVGEMNPADLVFGFSIPRSADPNNILHEMLKAVKYCQQHVGGKLLDKNGQAYNEEQERKEVESLVQKMKAQGMVPGSPTTLRMF